jgi:hypothetical protein
MRPQRDGHIFTWLDHVRRRPTMFIGPWRDAASLQRLETLVHGYTTALHVHGIVEPCPDLCQFPCWLLHNTGWSMSCGWAHAIATHSTSGTALDTFFDHIDHFRKLRPITVWTVKLGRHHAPAPHRKLGDKPDRDVPSRVDIVRYAPTQLHFLRSQLGRHAYNETNLYAGDGTRGSAVRAAKQSALAEFGILDADWSRPLPAH